MIVCQALTVLDAEAPMQTDPSTMESMKGSDWTPLNVDWDYFPSWIVRLYL